MGFESRRYLYCIGRVCWRRVRDWNHCHDFAALYYPSSGDNGARPAFAAFFNTFSVFSHPEI